MSTCSSASPGWSAWSPSSTLIFVPAISSYGRIWEKAAAGFLSLIVLVALVLTGVVVGLAIVYYYNDIVEIIG